MPLFAVRVGEPIAAAVKKKAEEENCTPSEIIRRCLAANIDNPGQYRMILDLNDRVSVIHEEVAKINCSSIANRAILMSAIETLTRGDVNLKDFEREIAVYEIMLRGVRYHGIETVDDLREFVRKALEKEDKGK